MNDRRSAGSPRLDPLSRRTAVTGAVAGLGLAAVGVAAARAQGATPIATPVTSENEAAFLFVQAGFDAGSLEPNGDGTYTLALDSAPDQTIYFSDRPQRVVGTIPTQQFLDVLGFDPANPPNAALVIAKDDGSTDIVVLELLSPVYDPGAETLTFTVTLLDEFGRLEATGMALTEQPLRADELPATFGSSDLFIDSLLGCSPWDPRC